MPARYSALVLLAVTATATAAAADPPDRAAALAAWERGREWYTKGDYDKALAEYDAAVGLDPTNSASFLSRGCTRAKKNQWAEAVKDFDEVVRLSPNNAWGYYNRGFARGAMQDYAAAMKDFDETIRLDPSHALAFLNRGHGWAIAKKFDRAIADYDQAAWLAPNHAPNYFFRGSAWAKKGDLEAAVRDYAKANRLDPETVSFLLDWCAYSLRGHDWNCAALDAEAATRLAPANPRGWHCLGEARKWLGDDKGALASFDEAIRLDPKYADALANRAIFRAGCADAAFRDGKKAVADAELACELAGWKSAYHLEARAAAAAEVGDFAGAVRWQKQAIADAEYMKRNGEYARDRLTRYEAGMPFRAIPIGRID